MFVRYFTEIPQPFDEVERALLADPERWVPGLARDAEGRGRELLADVGFAVDERRLDRVVVIELGQMYRMPSKTLLPMSWRAAGAEATIFPSLDADIEVAALGPTRTQLSISARYHVPLGVLGRAIDRALLHRVAEATIKDFLDRVGEAVSATATQASR